MEKLTLNGMNKYPYFGRPSSVNWALPGANKGQLNLIVKFVGPDEGRVVEGILGHPKGKYSKRWSEHNFKKIENYNE